MIMLENSGVHSNVIVFTSDCYEHQDHLIVKGGLLLVDSFLKRWDGFGEEGGRFKY